MSSISTGQYINGRNLFLTTFDVNDWPDKPLIAKLYILLVLATSNVLLEKTYSQSSA